MLWIRYSACMSLLLCIFNSVKVYQFRYGVRTFVFSDVYISSNPILFI